MEFAAGQGHLVVDNIAVSMGHIAIMTGVEKGRDVGYFRRLGWGGLVRFG